MGGEWRAVHHAVALGTWPRPGSGREREHGSPESRTGMSKGKRPIFHGCAPGFPSCRTRNHRTLGANSAWISSATMRGSKAASPQPIHPAIQVVHEPQLVVLVLAERRDGAVAGCNAAGQRCDLQLAGAGETADQQFAGAGVGEDVCALERHVGTTVDDAAGDRAAALLAASVLEHRPGGAGP